MTPPDADSMTTSASPATEAGRSDAEMAQYVREHRCYNARSDVSLADWDRGIAHIEAEARSVPTRPDEPLTVERLAAALRACPSAVMVTWTHESAATAILAALATPSEGEASDTIGAGPAGDGPP